MSLTTLSASPATHLKQLGSRGLILRASGYFWVCALGVLLSLAAYNAYQRATRVDEFAYSCDPFGYLNTAREIRQAVAGRQLPKFWLETSQTEVLINFMQAQMVPLPRWLDLVAPLAYHYFPRSGHVGCQYPPGTGLALALFPEGKAVVRLNKTVIALFLIIGVIGLVIAGMRQLWISAGFVCLASYLGLGIIGRIDSWSFSINASLPTLMLSFLFVFAALWMGAENHWRLAWLFSFVGGVFFGLGILIRLPVALLGAGFAVLLWPGSWRISRLNRLVPFAVGTVLTGIIPVLLFQQYETGAWYLPSYPPWATTPPGLQWVGRNLSFYFGSGRGSTDNWALVACLFGFLGVGLISRLRSPGRPFLSWQRLFASTVVLWAVPAAYFLTHETIIPYYSVPATFGAVVLLAFGVFTIESFARRNEIVGFQKKVAWPHFLAMGLAMVPGIIVLAGGWPLSAPKLVHPTKPRLRVHQVVLPQRLADPRAWVWADFLSGTLWYYASKPAFKIATTDIQTRAMVYRFVFERGDPQYLIRDSPYIKPIMDEILRMGGVLEPIPGGVEGAPCFQIRWPKGGPASSP